MIISLNPLKVPMKTKIKTQNILDSLRRTVSNHAVNIKAKALELCQLLPVSRVKQEKLNYKKARDESTKQAELEKLNKGKARKLKEAELDLKI